MVVREAVKLISLKETITSAEMNATDLNCEYYGLSRLQLMENAGRAVAEEIKKFKPEKVVVFAGTGNNGGDAFVASRFLSNESEVEIYLLGREVKTEIAKRNLELAKLSGVEVKVANTPDKLPEKIEADCVVDAMLGRTKGKLREPYSSTVELINSTKATVVAVDVPTGVNPDTGEFEEAVKANVTVTFHRLKPCFLKPEVKEYAGKVVVKSIGIPPAMEVLSGPGDVRLAFKRDEFGHKGKHGRILVVGGGPYKGAPFLSAISALKAGADLVFLAVPSEIEKVVSSYSPEIIVRGFNSPEELNFKVDVAVVGMGMEEKLAKEVLEVLNCEKFVLDASAIPYFELIEGKEVILTPHRGEAKKYLQIDSADELISFAKENGLTVLLKGKVDFITDGINAKVNTSGNSGMTVGGTGDVLAGICGAMLSNSSAFKAAVASSFLCGFAGDLSFEDKGYCLTAMDVVEKIPLAVKRCLEFS